MDILENQSGKLERLSEHVVEYLDTRWDLIVLGLTNKSSRVISSLASSVILGVLGLLTLLFLSVAAAVWAGQLMNSAPAGYLAVAGFYALLLLLVVAFGRNLIRNAIVSSVIKSLNDNDSDSNHDGQNS
jgi:hypothetical protein